MTRREITTHGWAAEDARRAERIRTERGDFRGPSASMVVFDEVAPSPWNGKLPCWKGTLPRWTGALTPWMTASADIGPDGLKVTLFRATSQKTEGDQR